MVTGWRRAFCTSVPKDRETNKVLSEKNQQQQHCENSSVVQSPKISSKFGFFSNPSTPRLQSQPVSSPSLRCRTSTATTTPTSSLPNSPKLQCKTSTTPKKNSSPRLFQLSNNPISPKSPSSFSLLKALRLSKSRCGICIQSVKTGQGTAIFTAECSHTFHFHCISSHIKKHQLLICPVCCATWKELPLLAVHPNPDATQAERDNANTINNKREFKARDVKTKCLRVYNDDEPLMSPTSGTRFNPIPESDENEEDENGAVEFQGFFVNSAPLSSPKVNDLFRDVKVSLLPEAAVVAVGKSYETYAVVLKVRAPPSPELNSARRAPIDLVTVLDVSTSMGVPKLKMMRRAMRLVISSLCATDRLSIIAFSASSKRLLPLTRMTTNGRRSARKIVDALGCVGQRTCVNDALLKAAKVLEDRRERNAVASIMLLSDGNDERGSISSTNQKRSSPAVVSSTRFAHLEIPIHAVGFGESGAYGHGHDEDAFAKCVGGLLSVVVQDLRIKLGFASGSAPAEIAGVYALTGRPAALGSGSARLGDLYAEEEREVLVELKIPASSIGSHHVLSVRPSFKDTSSQELVYCKEQALLIPRAQAARSSSPNIQRLRNLHVTTRAVAESRRMIEHNNLSGAYHLLSSARALLMQSKSEWAEEYLRGLEAELAELNRRRQHQLQTQRQRGLELNRVDEKPEPLTPTSAWRAAERLAKVAIMRKSMNRVSDLHGFENARF
ncbi:probable E3 ubiquitin-protein ligase EDA40 [Alnus glutinosa]|uniref:probable E3 ubiquitin-protein ligase EDA40 n=1 Tax=Alnus glutinosa TaxID=3517 RepID=UPI002D78199B|nr:probable E3 ubiquitin-protein ligase EDA40 [Alnus glutinosa]